MDGVQCAANAGSKVKSEVTRIPCVGRGRAVRVVHPGKGKSLRFAEVEVSVLQQPDANGSYTSSTEAEVEALKHTLKLLALAAPDFHSTNTGAASVDARPLVAPQPSGGRGYKSVVVVYLFGGADSFNMVVPYSGCKAKPVAGNSLAAYN